MIQLRRADGGKRLTSAESLLALGFLAVILAGTVLLALPVAARGGRSIGLFDSLFTATSAVCVTGLVAVDTGATFSLFGQAVLMVLIQVGGLGFMVFATMIMVMLGRKISLKGRMLIRESMNRASLSDLSDLTRLYLALALVIELLGAGMLSIRFVPMYGLRHGLWMALFHSVSAFCNAGFDLFGGFSSLTMFAHDPLVLLTVALLIVLVLSGALLGAGTVFYLLTESFGKGVLAGRGFGEQLLNAFFQSVTMRTAGFNSVDLAALRDGSKLFSTFLMVIGASPASTGGGVKTTTAAALFFLILNVIRGENEVRVSRRALPLDTVRRAFTVITLFLTVQLLGTVLISLFEDGRFSLADIWFEAASAMGTVGVSSIGTPNLTLPSRAVLPVMMFLGRVGPLTLALALAGRQNRARTASKFPEERIMIG